MCFGGNKKVCFSQLQKNESVSPHHNCPAMYSKNSYPESTTTILSEDPSCSCSCCLLRFLFKVWAVMFPAIDSGPHFFTLIILFQPSFEVSPLTLASSLLPGSRSPFPRACWLGVPLDLRPRSAANAQGCIVMLLSPTDKDSTALYLTTVWLSIGQRSDEVAGGGCAGN